VVSFLLTAALGLTIAVSVQWWPRLPAGYQRRLSIVASLFGLGFLVAALRSEGLRETALTSIVLLGPATLTARASAAASLYYYVLTGVSLLLGFAGLIWSDAISRFLRPRPLFSLVAVAWLLTAVRVLLEMSAAPQLLVEAVGVAWLAPVAGVYLALCLPREHGVRELARALVRYAYLVRGFVALVGVLATRLAFGTHYDVSPLTEVGAAFASGGFSFVPGSLTQLFWLTLLPQLVVWPAFTVLVGLATGLVTLYVTRELTAVDDAEPAPAQAASEEDVAAAARQEPGATPAEVRGAD
jgi:hypothetical protein